MSRHRRMLLVAAAVVALLLVTSTGGVSTAAIDRTAQVAVVADEDAYLGFEQTTSGTANGTTNLTVTVTNQFGADITLSSVEVAVDGRTADLAAGDPLSPGEAGSTTFESVPCGDSIRVEATASGTLVRLNRSVDCS